MRRVCGAGESKGKLASLQRKTSFTASSQRVHSEFTAQNYFYSEFTASLQRKTSFTASSQRVYSEFTESLQRKTSFTASSQLVYTARRGVQRLHKSKSMTEKKKHRHSGSRNHVEFPVPEMGIKKRPAASKGLKEGNAQAEQKAENAATTEAPPQPDKVDKARGLQEGQDEDPQATATQKPDETEQGNEAEAATRKRKATPGAPSEAGVSLTSKRLKLHEETQEAIAGLKEGQLSEEEFWKTIHKSDIASLWKKFEWSRGKTPEAQEAWQQMAGPGVLAKKKQALLHFLKTGKNQEGCLQESQEASTSKKDKELFEWVPWKQILDW